MKRLFAYLLIILPSVTASAQVDNRKNDYGADISLGVEKKLTNSLGISFDTGFRTQDHSTRAERWSMGATLDYKFLNTKTFDLKASAGWEYIWQQRLTEAELTKKNNIKITKRYWRHRHRTSLGLGASFKPNKRWTFSLKETVQYNHYAPASTTVSKYEYKYLEPGKQGYSDEPDEVEEKCISAKDRFILRSKLGIQYDIRKNPFAPFAAVDYGCGLNYPANKWKITAGTDIKLSKMQKISVFYRYQTEDDDDEPNGHILGLSYNVKF